MSKETRQKHYVQQCYLRNFSCNNDMKHIHALLKEKNKVLHDQPIGRVVCEGGFYDIDVNVK